MCRTSSTLGFTILAVAIALCGGNSAHAATISFSADPYDADADISTDGTLVEAFNLGTSSVLIVANGVTFAADNGAFSLAVNSPSDSFNAANYVGGGIGTLSSADASALLDGEEFGPGLGNTLGRISGLTPGAKYQFQVLLSNRNVGTLYNIGNDVGGSPVWAIEDIPADAGGTSPYVATGVFLADAATQDFHLARTVASTGLIVNFTAQGYQLRQLPVPEPSTFVLAALGMMGLLRVRRRRRA